ncbi:SH3 domain-containing protein [Paenibacillus faecis]|uniref:SH3 domain-containing protein n=1 Tax=Paenibacillus faecis TaxID=862114 RepID=A0A5D0CRI6_9BACL|nr:SH3 domain-containing protein [Paenibacillus faecis]TYA12561.1 SH3 domain-containing protein [Paenibacillus faecis]
MLKRIGLFVILLSFFLVISQTTASVYAEGGWYGKHTSVMDVKLAGLNVRSGPGTSYPIIAQVSKGEDLVRYCPTTPNGCSPVGADGQEWLRNYYPDGNIGYYANAALGWIAWYSSDGGLSNKNYNYTQTAKVNRTSYLYTGDCPNLNSRKQTYDSPGEYQPAYDSELSASVCNPNAWRVRNYDITDYGFANGWNLNAE